MKKDVFFIQQKNLKKLTLGQKAADSLAKWAGSWTFIIFFIFFILSWILINSYFAIKFFNNIFDPFPFILLNLMLSCLAAIQAPIILMSQNRAAERDRLRSEYDYAVDKKAEKEIREIKADIISIKKRLNIK
jgi:uncharacterized membrane protein